jgi:hypothetical protein
MAICPSSLAAIAGLVRYSFAADLKGLNLFKDLLPLYTIRVTVEAM